MFKRLASFYIRKDMWYLNLVVRWSSFWIGLHRSSAGDSYCLALLPCIVLQWTNDPLKPKDCRR